MMSFALRLMPCVGAAILITGHYAAAEPPRFSPNPAVGWIAIYNEFQPPASGPGPVLQDPAHPRVSNDEFRRTGRQPTPAVADLKSPILQPWAREALRKRNVLALAG